MLHQGTHLRLITGMMSLLLVDAAIRPHALVSAKKRTSEMADQVESCFRVYNPEVPKEVAIKFAEVVREFHLEPHYKMCIYHICLESSVNPLAESPTGAMGLCQITPTTAFHVLHHLTPQEQQRLLELGVDDFEWALNGSYSSNKMGRAFIATPLRKKAMAWLQKPTNNLALWGHIMSNYFSTMRPNKAFLSYRMGVNGAKNYKGDIDSHPYILGLLRVEKVLNKKGA